MSSPTTSFLQQAACWSLGQAVDAAITTENHPPCLLWLTTEMMPHPLRALL